MKLLGDFAAALILASLTGLVIYLGRYFVLDLPLDRLAIIGTFAALLLGSGLLLFVLEYPQKEKPPERAAF